jgi:hypothetical protein
MVALTLAIIARPSISTFSVRTHPRYMVALSVVLTMALFTAHERIGIWWAF